MSEHEVAALWRSRHDAAFVFVRRDLKRQYGHAFPTYCFPELGLLLHDLGFGFADSAWRFPLHPGSASAIRSCSSIPHPERMRFTDRVTYSEPEDTFTRTLIPAVRMHRYTGSVLGVWQCIGAQRFTVSKPDDAEALAALCERREFVFDARTKLAEAGRLTGASA